MFSLQYALTQLWLSWGFTPTVVMGHSLGEFMAAQLAGVYSLEDAVKLVAERGRLTEDVPAVGMMASVQASEETVTKALAAYGDNICIAAINGPDSVVITGIKAEVNDLLSRFEREGINVRRLAISNAFHSQFIDPALDNFSRVAAEVTYHQPKLPLVSTLTGQLLGFDLQSYDLRSTILDPRSSIHHPQTYWRRHLREPVQFYAAMRTLHEMGVENFLEIGPNPTQLGMGRRCLPEDYGNWFPSLRQGRDDWQQLLESLGAMFVNGFEIDWQRFEQDYARRRVTLPTYPFQRKRFWLEEGRSKREDRRAQSSSFYSRSSILHPLLESCTQSPLLKETLFETRLSAALFPYLEDHKIHGMIVLPLTGHLEIILASARRAFGASVSSLEDVTMHEPLLVPEKEERAVQLVFKPEANGAISFQLISLHGPAQAREHKVHVTGLVALDAANATTVREDLHVLQTRCAEEIFREDFYRGLHERGLQFGPRFQGLQKLWRGIGEALGQIVLPGELREEADAHFVHPALLDACLQVFVAAWPKEGTTPNHAERIGEGAIVDVTPPLREASGVLPVSSNDAEETKSTAAINHEKSATHDDTPLKGEMVESNATFLPLRVESYRLHRRASAELWSHVLVRGQENRNAETYLGEVAIYDAHGNLVAELKGLLLKRTTAEALHSVLQSDIDDWFYETVWRKQPPLSANAQFAPAQIAAATQELLPPLRAEKDLAAYEELLPQLDQLCAAYVAHALQQLGWNFTSGRRFTTQALAQQLGVIARHRRLFERMLAMLAEENVLQREGEEWRVCRAPEKTNLETLAAALLEKYPASATELQLTIKCGNALTAVLCGKQEPLQLLFPDGSVELLERLYQHSPLTQAMNRLAARALAEASAKFPRARKLRVLEIGAGTGGTTAFVLPQLRAENTEYFFTDVSPLFLAKAKEKFGEYGFVQYRTLDIERSPLAQNFSGREFDVVIATNALHATADLRQSLRHARELLREDGLALFIEGTTPERWVDLTFGLTEGWWRFTDADLRSASPLISKQDWIDTLAELGFSGAHTLPSTEEEGKCGRALGQHAMILARAAAQESTKASWLIFADESRTSEHLQTLLQAHAHRIVLVRPGSAYEKLNENSFVLAAQRPEDFQQLLRDALHESECAGVIYLWANGLSTRATHSLEELEQTQIKSGAAVLHLAQALIKADLPSTPRLWLVTRNAQPVLPHDGFVEAVQASLWGLAQTIGLEHPELHCTRVDLDAGEEAAAQSLFAEIFSRDREEMIAYRAGERYVARLARCEKIDDRGLQTEDREARIATDDPRSSIIDPQSSSAQQLTLAAPGVLDSMRYQPATRRAPLAHEVEIRVHAVGLNFRDVLNALGMYPGDAGALGGDCSGVVVAAGEEATNFRAGDEVLALATGSFSTFVITHESLVAHKSKALRHVEASTIPSAFLTAYYALITLGKLQKGERVLIHSASGGVGLAAVQLAQRTGAEIFATAGNEEKRAYLRGLGVQHLFDSRSTNFAQEIKTITHNEGVDVVLNSLTGESIPAGLSALKENGRFVEIGKRGIWTHEQVAASKPRAAYHVIDLAAVAHENPDMIKSLFADFLPSFTEGSLRPLPLKLFPAKEVVSAFRCMQGAKHIGKIVVEQGARDEAQGARSEADILRHAPCPMPHATYLITGGLAGLGLLTAQWLVEQGARHLALMARSRPSESARAAIAEMEKRGAKIFTAQGDVSREADVKSVLFEIRKSLPPLRGIIHSAGVLDDGALLQQNWSRFETVLGPKVRGAWLLHQLTQEDPIEMFVLYSSLTSMLGVRGQGNHAMANAFLDGLAHYRRKAGQAGVSIHWGAWSEIGAAAARKVGERIGDQGVGVIAPQKGLQALAKLLHENRIEVGVLPITWAKYAAQLGETPSPFLSEVLASAPSKAQNRSAGTRSKPQPKILEQLQRAPLHLRKNLLLGYVKDQALRVLGLEASHPLDKEQPLQKMGLDSLMSVELRNVLGAGLGLKRALPATLLFDYPTVAAVTDYLAKDVLALEASSEVQNGKAQSVVVEKEKQGLEKKELAQLSEEEAEALLLEELGQR